MSNKYVKISPSGELMGEPSLVHPDFYWEEDEEELLLQQWQQSENDEETKS